MIPAFHFIFFLMIQRPPRSTLFPYTTLFRSALIFIGPMMIIGISQMRGFEPGDRSEEHTSELQSPDHLVCRLLLEKKNHSDCHASDYVKDMLDQILCENNFINEVAGKPLTSH